MSDPEGLPRIPSFCLKHHMTDFCVWRALVIPFYQCIGCRHRISEGGRLKHYSKACSRKGLIVRGYKRRYFA